MAWKYTVDFQDKFKSSGIETTVQVLANTGGECLFDYQGERHSTDTSLFGSGTCKYLPGEEMTVYKANGGWWGIKEDAKP